MSQVRVHNFSVSLDGFDTGEGQSLDAPHIEAVNSPSGVTHVPLSRR